MGVERKKSRRTRSGEWEVEEEEKKKKKKYIREKRNGFKKERARMSEGVMKWLARASFCGRGEE